ncbi:MAG: hypothetical protein AAFO83_10695 [Cyanobacteria bacterium J06607_13]
MRRRSLNQVSSPVAFTRLFTLLGGSACLAVSACLVPAATAQPLAQVDTSAPTARYASGLDVDLADIVAEWRGYYDDVPVYLCVCQDGTCDQTEQWPYRTFDRYQMSVALGPTNGEVAEASGANCFDIADGSRPSNPRAFVLPTESTAAVPDAAPEPISESEPPTVSVAPSDSSAIPAVISPTEEPAAVVDSPPTVNAPVVAPPVDAGTETAVVLPSTFLAPPNAIPTATVVNNGADIQLDWPSGRANVVNVAGSTWNLSVLDAVDCASLNVVDQKVMEAQRVIAEPVVDGITGNVAVPVLLDSCVETDQSAVFILDPTEGGGYALYRAQLPGDRNFPNEFSSYAFSSIISVGYWNGALSVRQGSASGAEALMRFRSDGTPSGTYAGCGVLTAGEGISRLCNE